ncbi:MAG: hypothetical protein A4E61_01090 [Syntrophorhabdus sp. PtaB.Bin184]|nr:MAG: hypothetical protein A4E61_01090 [Syntrophorhabdus sp. PtaB.Bin184]
MKISTETSCTYIGRPVRTVSVTRAGSPSFSVALTAATVDTAKAGGSGVKQSDFTHMTRKELFDWMNSKIGSGEMSFEESSPFLAMTLKIPVRGGQGSSVTLDDRERVNFVQKALDGIKGALSRNDQEGARQLQAALNAMQRFQGRSTEV